MLTETGITISCHWTNARFIEPNPDKYNGTPRRGQSIPRPASGGAMLTLLRLPY
jgi:hypothetical protein